ncbi:MAG: EF-hand domain-containing protein [Betaproteobacteria bacterium]
MKNTNHASAAGRWLLLPCALLTLSVQAVEPARVVTDSNTAMQDPWVPPALRNAPAATPTQGAELRAQVEAKLKDRFQMADTKSTGTLTREQAQAAGLGFVVKHFDQIDVQKTGAVKFDDIKVFLRERGARLD